MSTRRVIKKASYAATYVLAISLFVVFLAYLRRLPSEGSPEPSPSPASRYQDAIVQEKALIHHGSTVDIVAQIANPNAGAGAKSIPVTFEVRSAKGNILATRTEDTYLLPGSSKYVSLLNLPLPSASEVNVSLPQQQEFIALPPKLPLPQFNTFLYERSFRQSGDNVFVEQKGLITNNSTYDFQRVEVTVIGYDSGNRITSIGKTFVGKLQVGEQREFTALWQQPAAQVTKVIASPETNIFKEDNLIRIMGDPSSLR